jgi:hypothetical protein
MRHVISNHLAEARRAAAVAVGDALVDAAAGLGAVGRAAREQARRRARRGVSRRRGDSLLARLVRRRRRAEHLAQPHLGEERDALERRLRRAPPPPPPSRRERRSVVVHTTGSARDKSGQRGEESFAPKKQAAISSYVRRRATHEKRSARSIAHTHACSRYTCSRE